MALWTSEQAIEATGGTARGPAWQADGVSIDTRTIRAGDIFVALTDVRDGHDFVAAAFAAGASAALVSRIPDDVPDDAPLLVVDDVLIALERLGQAARARTQARVIAVTGSAGKTSTKEMLRHTLAGQGTVHAAEASYNNHWGVPLTLARMPQETDFAVIEIGMNHPGEIAPLSKVARPHVALVTTVAAAHLEAFEGLEAIAEEKAAIFEGLEPDGAAVFNADLDTTSILSAHAANHAARSVSFGTVAEADVRAEIITAHETSSVVSARANGEAFLFKIGAPGRHFALNALGALAAAVEAGADLDIACCDIAGWRPPQGRGQREVLRLDPVEGLTALMIDDAFNANPASLAASLDVLSITRPTNGVGRVGHGRRIAVLGDMLELGPDEASLHAAVADYPSLDHVDVVHTVGPRMRALHDALPEAKRGRWRETAEALASEVHSIIDAGDVILVKGSKGIKVSLVVDALRKLSRQDADTDTDAEETA